MIIPQQLFPSLRILKLCFQIQPASPLEPFLYQGSAWRGILGWELQKLICPFERQTQCEACIIQGSCPYFLLLEKKSQVSGLFEAPKGYVLYPDQDHTGLRLDVTLFGTCADFVPALVEALKRAQKRGLGRERIPFAIQGLFQVLPDGGLHRLEAKSSLQDALHEPFPLSELLSDSQEPISSLGMDLVTPLRLRRQGKYVNRFDPVFYLEALARRLEALTCLFAGGKPLGREKWETLRSWFENELESMNPAKSSHGGNTWTADLKWRDYARFSSRQKRKVPMGGLVGRVGFSNPSPELVQWLKVAELVHVGKGAVMGLGKMCLEMNNQKGAQQ